PQLAEDPFALNAIDQAAHDLAGKLDGRRTFEMFNLEWKNIPHSSFTIGIDRIEKMLEKLNETPNYPIYKVKLGTEHDLEIIRRLRNETDAVLRVDANCAWTPEQAISHSEKLK